MNRQLFNTDKDLPPEPKRYNLSADMGGENEESDHATLSHFDEIKRRTSMAEKHCRFRAHEIACTIITRAVNPAGN